MYYELKNKQLKSINASKLHYIFFVVYIFLGFYEGYINQFVGSLSKYYIFFIILFFVLGYKNIKIAWYHGFFLLWFALKIASIYWGGYNEIVALHFLSQIGFIGLFLAITIVRFNKRYVNFLLLTTMYMSFSLAILGLFFSEPYLGLASSRRVLTLFNYQIDPNNLAVLYLIGFGLALHYFIFSKKHNLASMIIIVVNGFSVVLTGSRGSFISMIFLVIVLGIGAASKKRNFSLMRKRILILTLMSIIFLLSVNLLLPDIVFERVFTFIDYESGSGRREIWQNAIGLLSKNPIFGTGWGTYWGYNAMYKTVHNTFLSMLVDVGLIGVLLFLIPIGKLLVYSMKRKSFLIFVVIFSSFGPAFFLESINKRFFWNAIIFSFMIYLSGLDELFSKKESEGSYV